MVSIRIKISLFVFCEKWLSLQISAMRGPANFPAGSFPILPLLILALLPFCLPAPLLLRDGTANWNSLNPNLPSLEDGTVERLASSSAGSGTKKWNQDETGSEAARLTRKWKQLPVFEDQLRRVKKTGESTRRRWKTPFYLAA